MCLRVVVGRLRKIVMDSSEFAAEPRAEIRQRTTRIDKSYQQRFALEVCQANRFSIWIDQFHIGYVAARRKSMNGGCGFRSFSAAGVGNADVVEPVVLPVFGDHVSCNFVAGFHNRSREWG